MLTHQLLVGNVFDQLQKIKSNSIHVLITSPPYWGLRRYSHGKHASKEIGQEDCLESHVGAMMRFLGDCWRVLRPDGTLWLCIGDTYTDDTKFSKDITQQQGNRITGLPRQSLLGMPWRIALGALKQGWTIRSEIIVYNPTAVASGNVARPTTAHQTLFMLTKTDDYFYDAIGSAEASTLKCRLRKSNPKALDHREMLVRGNARLHESMNMATSCRRLRTVWTVPINKSPKALPPKTTHHARFTLNLPMKILSAAVSQHGCCGRCGTQYTRIIEKNKRQIDGQLVLCYDTAGWTKSCSCKTTAIDRPTVLDTFAGSCTTLVAALRSNCHAIGIELNPGYVKEGQIWLRQERGQLKNAREKDVSA